ncbi:MAG: hypothetical protein DKM50_04335 [Candidatus Margulisiibacteriota bacterium]|nr:MAG: hypothetical protein A2X42_05700 [Candidatus Margulisbacteria bacterium GWF2_38_17]PZM82109.1 MAG: hypothetical protein DKM50_04335 [Candidatus Margulisiibacteriota bacterium]HAR63632.1 hypothetical protein [Candidatus Margulisiibacteriota bacterium]HCT84376.1 hypothetical protein [Candidatus Margulisiibacteriota bacterium]
MNHLAFIKGREPIDLSRDLKLAIGEYAPGNQVIASKLLFNIDGIKVLKDKKIPEINYAICLHCNRFYKDKDIPESKICCADTLEIKQYLTPEYGFICNKVPEKALGRLPNRDRVVDIETFAGPYDMQFKPFILGFHKYLESQGSIAYINTNKKFGYHFDKNTGESKNVKIKSNLHLGYDFATDILALLPSDIVSQFNIYNLQNKYWPKDIFDGDENKAFWYSIIFGIINTACEYLDLDDRALNGLVTRINGKDTLIIYDTVPGGAGFSRRVHDNFSGIINSIVNKMEKCSCDSSCYNCLRGYSNQKHHYRLNRLAVIDYFNAVLGKE